MYFLKLNNFRTLEVVCLKSTKAVTKKSIQTLILEGDLCRKMSQTFMFARTSYKAKCHIFRFDVLLLLPAELLKGMKS